MGTTVAKVIEWMNALAPPDLAYDWDNVGLHTSAPDSWVERVLVALTLEPAVLDEADEVGAQLIVLHHPAVFRPLRHVRSDEPESRLVVRAIRSNIALFSAHTNVDVAPGGLNEWLADRLGLQSTETLVSRGGLQFGSGEPAGRSADGAGEKTGNAGAADAGLGRIGALPRPLTVEEFARWVTARLGLPVVRVVPGLPDSPRSQPTFGVDAATGGGEEQAAHHERTERGLPEAPDVRAARRLIERVAVIGGAGAEYWRAALNRGADALVTGDVKYHDALDAAHSGLVLLDAGHFGTERCFVDEVTRYLRSRADKVGVLLDVLPSARGIDPFRMM